MELEQAQSATGKETGAGTFAEGCIEPLSDANGYFVAAAGQHGHRYRSVVETIIYDNRRRELTDKIDVTGFEFRLSESELHIR